MRSNTLVTNVKSQIIGEDPDAGKVLMEEEKGTKRTIIGCINNSMDMTMRKLGEMVKDRVA